MIERTSTISTHGSMRAAGRKTEKSWRPAWCSTGWMLVKTAVMQGFDDGIPARGAALAFYAMLSMIPILALLLLLIGTMYDADAARHYIQAAIDHVAGPAEAGTIKGLLSTDSSTENKGLVATIVNFLILFFGASSVFTQLQSVLNFIWKVPASDKSVIRALAKEYSLAFLMVIGIGVLLFLFIIFGAIITAIMKLAVLYIPQFAGMVKTVSALVSVGFMTLVFACAFKMIPHMPIRWRDVWGGAIITAVLFVAGQFLIGFYLAHSNVTAGYGAAGSVVALLIWIYYSAQMFFFGAEFTQVYAHRIGSYKDAKKKPLAAASK